MKQLKILFLNDSIEKPLKSIKELKVLLQKDPDTSCTKKNLFEI